MSKELLDLPEADHVTNDSYSADNGFRVDDDKSANWLVRQITQARAYADQVRQWAKDEVRRAEREEEKLLYLFGAQLEDWCRDQLLRDGGRRRSVALPAGRVGFRKQPAQVQVMDEGQLESWCELEHPDALALDVESRGETSLALANLLANAGLPVTLKRRVLISEVRAMMRSTGELPAGVEVGASRDRFFIE